MTEQRQEGAGGVGAPQAAAHFAAFPSPMGGTVPVLPVTQHETHRDPCTPQGPPHPTQPPPCSTDSPGPQSRSHEPKSRTAFSCTGRTSATLTPERNALEKRLYTVRTKLCICYIHI